VDLVTMRVRARLKISHRHFSLGLHPVVSILFPAKMDIDSVLTMRPGRQPVATVGNGFLRFGSRFAGIARREASAP
jgi:hypothetical protein